MTSAAHPAAARPAPVRPGLDAATTAREIADLPEARLAALIRFHDGMARTSRGTETECRETDLDEAARRNSLRATAYAETAEILQRLLFAAFPEPPEFRAHLKAAPKPRAEIRAPP